MEMPIEVIERNISILVIWKFRESVFSTTLYVHFYAFIGKLVVKKRVLACDYCKAFKTKRWSSKTSSFNF